MSLRTFSTDKKIRKKLKKTKIKSQETVSKNKNYCLIIVNTSDKNIHVHYQVENDICMTKIILFIVQSRGVTRTRLH